MLRTRTGLEASPELPPEYDDGEDDHDHDDGEDDDHDHGAADDNDKKNSHARATQPSRPCRPPPSRSLSGRTLPGLVSAGSPPVISILVLVILAIAIQHRHQDHDHDDDRLRVVRNKTADIVVGQAAVGMGGSSSGISNVDVALIILLSWW